MSKMTFEVEFFDENDKVVEGYYFACYEASDVAYDAIERANADNIGYEYAILSDFEINKPLAEYHNGEWEWY